MGAKQYLNAFINNSATIREVTGASITNAAHKVVAYKNDGTVILPANTGDPAIGIVLSDAPGAESGSDIVTAAGTEVDVLVKDIGLAEAAAAIAKGALVTATSSGTVQTASAGNFILGIALTAASAAGELVQVQITKSGYAPAAAVSLKLGDLTDVDLTTPATDGQVLKYDSSATKWKAAADATE